MSSSSATRSIFYAACAACGRTRSASRLRSSTWIALRCTKAGARRRASSWRDAGAADSVNHAVWLIANSLPSPPWPWLSTLSFAAGVAGDLSIAVRRSGKRRSCEFRPNCQPTQCGRIRCRRLTRQRRPRRSSAPRLTPSRAASPPAFAPRTMARRTLLQTPPSRVRCGLRVKPDRNRAQSGRFEAA